MNQQFYRNVGYAVSSEVVSNSEPLLNFSVIKIRLQFF